MKRLLDNNNEKCERKIRQKQAIATSVIATSENLTHNDVLDWFVSTSKKEKNNVEDLPQSKPTPKPIVNIPLTVAQKPRDYLKDLDDKLGELNIEYFKTSGLPQQIVDFFLEIDIKKHTCRTIINHLFYSKERSDIYIQKTKELIHNTKSEMIKYYQIKKDKNFL